MTEALTSVMRADNLDGAVATDADAMAPHIAHMHKMLDIATYRPDDFYYAVVIVGKDGREPALHGTLSGGLLGVVGALFTDELDTMYMQAARGAGMGVEEIFEEMATVDRPDLMFALEGGHDDALILGGDVAGPQPTDGFDIEGLYAELKEAGFAEVAPGAFIGTAGMLQDLNGDGVVDEKDEVIRLQRLADDGNPHSGE